MKRISTFIMVLACTFASAQTIDDVVRYSTENIQGTARFQAMGGAFGALGGDLSSLNVNPAGSAVFNYSEVGITGSNYHSNNDVRYGNSLRNTKDNSLNLNQVGGVFVFNSTNSPWKKIALAFNYDMVQNFDNEIFAAGSSTSGIDNYFLNFAQGQPLGPLRVQQGEFIEEAYLDIGANLGYAAQQAFLGFQAGLIEPDVDDDANTGYFSNAEYSSLNQSYLRTTSGYNSKFTLNVATQYEENLYLGATVNFHNVLYDRVTYFDEDGYDQASPVQFTSFDNFLHTEGYGFSFSLGAIAKLNESVRVGGSYQSPTWYRLTDDTSQRINSSLAVSDINFINFGIVNLYDEYKIRTPEKYTGSVAIVFGQDGLISFDYGYQDMSKAELGPTSDPNFAAENDFISTELGAVNSFRLGGEYRIERVSLRAGYRFEESPYENTDFVGDLNGFSAGIGYDFGGSRLDLAYSRSEQDVNTYLFDSGIDNAAMVNRINTNISLGYTMKF
ncbi:Outer membrane protein transport protein (OMPP1/FadL/TodX) [Flagellimonas taeanensis]|uniref:Outer membrane protein transport protein (OMPP1/FadL/TodX) n=1 Tax=Flagellimonas taeanensis TaxID=1005926 RepID=A0A1M6RJE3_9FLAO|nr:outer membrane protein transport protein [Allomuricauda taeanensis]SFB75697.1 Outer membrane protein transport protein (OMPP1/FadL/TodX) [Allomuricauda taeanensis]SHK32550.1 Outer membrane protein transport protein (OMPP1/FadL/TodX) [Allomuricauda taeanensis]